MTRNPYEPPTERTLGLAALGTIALCAATGAGVGVFLREPELGAIAGGVAGIVLSVLVVPRLLRDWRE
ncbi:MAG TPA: hypothetical protein VIL04_05040 [Solirubrobacterales bacterium]|jgi:outer membrane lipoprotein SlyB